jgi:phosphoribosylformylglycinamidine cyclo-ligase
MQSVVSAARLEESEAFRTFNMGIGMVLMLRPADVDASLRHFKRLGIPASVIGEVAAARKGGEAVELEGGSR